MSGPLIQRVDHLSPYGILKAEGYANRYVEPPVPIASIARGLGVEVHLVEDVDFVGGCAMEGPPGKGPQIYVHEELARPRRRFVVAHELAHLALHGGQDSDFWRRELNLIETDREEWEANLYGRCFLMPEFMVDPLTLHFGTHPPEIAEFFLTPIHVARERLHTLYDF